MKSYPEIRIDGNGNIVLVGSDNNTFVIYKSELSSEQYRRLLEKMEALHTASAVRSKADQDKAFNELRNDLFNLVSELYKKEDGRFRELLKEHDRKKDAERVLSRRGNFQTAMLALVTLGGATVPHDGHGAGYGHDTAGNWEDTAADEQDPVGSEQNIADELDGQSDPDDLDDDDFDEDDLDFDSWDALAADTGHGHHAGKHEKHAHGEFEDWDDDDGSAAH